MSEQPDLFGQMPIATGSIPKLCSRCLETKARHEFRRNAKNIDGLHSWCAPCISANSRARYVANKEIYRNRNRKQRRNTRALNLQLKRARGGCEALRIGLTECDVRDFDLLVWHHIDPRTKAGDPSTLTNLGSAKKLKDEVRKCVALCPNCHARFHRTERQGAA